MTGFRFPIVTLVLGLLWVGALHAQSPDADRAERYVQCLDEIFGGPDPLPAAAAQKRMALAVEQCQREAQWRIVSQEAYDRCWRNTARAAGASGESVIHAAQVGCAAKYGTPLDE